MQFGTANIPTQESFSLRVEEMVAREGEYGSYIESTSELMEELDLDPVDAKHLLSQTLIDKITHEAMSNNLLKVKNTTSSVFDFC